MPSNSLPPTSKHQHSLLCHRNLWLKLPKEIQDKIFDFADPLTQYLNNRGDCNEKNVEWCRTQCQEQHRLVDVWTAAIKMDWDGDFERIPFTNLFNENELILSTVSKHIKTRRQLRCLKKRGIIEGEALITIGMENMWHDVLLSTETLQDRRDLRSIAVRQAQFDYFLYILQDYHWIPENEVHLHISSFVENAAFYGDLDAVKHFHELSPNYDDNYEDTAWAKWFSPILENAARNGHLDIIKYVLEHPIYGTNCKAMEEAAANGELKVIKYLQEKAPPGLLPAMTTQAMDRAAENGHLETVKHLHETDPAGCTKEAMHHAAVWNYFAIVKFLNENRSEKCYDYTMEQVAEAGHFEIVKYLHEQAGMSCTLNALLRAAEIGNLEMVEYLHSQKGWVVESEDVSKSLDKVAAEGHHRILQILYNYGNGRCTSYGMRSAASNGHLEIVKFILSQGSVQEDSHAMDNAAKGGYLDIVQYLHTHGTAGCISLGVTEAAANGHLEVVKFLHEHRTGCFCDVESAMERAAKNGHLDVVMFLSEHRPEE
jgi:ankyrin repeat protein